MWFAVLAVVAFVVAVVVVVPVWATDTPGYCASCKATKPAGESWKRSSHATVSCVECHIPPGTVNAIKWRSTEWLNIWADYLNVAQIPSKGRRPTNENCLECHSLENIPSESNGVRVPHEAHVDLRNLACVDCHAQVAHPEPGATGTQVSMAVCSMCHDEVASTNECDFCHSTPPERGERHPTDFLAEHGKPALADEQACLRCHHNKQQFCDGCHENPPPSHFAGDWSYAHGQQADKDGAQCLGCHTEQELCDQCHTVDHPADWAASHAPVAAKGDRSCLVCHSQQMCVECHRAEGVVTQ
jgi:nitrate/TMAO reductase-like tetraheme cytochrome c subunit